MKKLVTHSIIFALLILGLCSCSSKKSTELNHTIEILNTNCKNSIRALSIVDENTIWAGASEGRILKSIDGGLTWKIFKIAKESKNDFRSIHAWSKDEAIIFGITGPNFGYKTLNGGKTWEVVYNDATIGTFFNSLKFANDSIGLAVSDAIDDHVYLIKTTNRGKTWKRVPNTPKQHSGEYNFAASNTCIEFLPSGKAWIASGGSTTRVFYSSDFGNTWKVSNTPMICGNESSGIFSIEFINEKEGIIVGGTYDQPELDQKIAAYTNDGGINWKLSAKMPAEFRSCIQAFGSIDDNFQIAVGKTGIDYSIDNGKTWNFVDSTGFFTFRPIPNKKAGIAAGADGSMAKLIFE